MGLGLINDFNNIVSLPEKGVVLDDIATQRINTACQSVLNYLSDYLSKHGSLLNQDIQLTRKFVSKLTKIDNSLFSVAISELTEVVELQSIKWVQEISRHDLNSGFDDLLSQPWFGCTDGVCESITSYISNNSLNDSEKKLAYRFINKLQDIDDMIVSNGGKAQFLDTINNLVSRLGLRSIPYFRNFVSEKGLDVNLLNPKIIQNMCESIITYLLNRTILGSVESEKLMLFVQKMKPIVDDYAKNNNVQQTILTKMQEVCVLYDAITQGKNNLTLELRTLLGECWNDAMTIYLSKNKDFESLRQNYYNPDDSQNFIDAIVKQVLQDCQKQHHSRNVALNLALDVFQEQYKQKYLLFDEWLYVNSGKVIQPFNQSNYSHVGGNMTGVCYSNSLNRASALISNPSEILHMKVTNASLYCQNVIYEQPSNHAVGTQNLVKEYGMVRDNDVLISLSLASGCPMQELEKAIAMTQKTVFVFSLSGFGRRYGHAINLQLDTKLGIFRIYDDNIGVIQCSDSVDLFKTLEGLLKSVYFESKHLSEGMFELETFSRSKPQSRFQKTKI